MIRCCRDRCEPGTECGCADCSAKKWPQYAKRADSEQMVGICRACQGMLVSRNGTTVHASIQTTCPGVIRR
jgi:hypothetical protein